MCTLIFTSRDRGTWLPSIYPASFQGCHRYASAGSPERGQSEMGLQTPLWMPCALLQTVTDRHHVAEGESREATELWTPVPLLSVTAMGGDNKDIGG